MKKLLALIAFLSTPVFGVVGGAVQPIVNTSQVLYGSNVKTITSTSTVTIDTTTAKLTVKDIQINGTCTGSGCGSPTPGGASTLATYNGSTQISSPTVSVGGDSTSITTYLIGTSSAGFKANSSSVTLQGNQYSIAGIAADTGTITTRLVSVGVSTASLQTQVNNLNTSTATIATSTASLQTQVNALNTSTATIATSTASLQTQANALGVSTNTLAVSTGTLYTLANGKVSYSSFSAVSPITFNSVTGAIGATPISLSSQVVGTLPAENMVSTVAFTNSTQTFTGGNTFSSATFTLVNGVTPGLVPGTNIASITGAWPNQTINATTQGGGGTSSLSVGTGTASAYVFQASSPTAILSFDGTTFASSLKGGATAYITMVNSSVTLQGNSISLSALSSSMTAVGLATGTIQSSLTTGLANVATSTAAIGVSTAALQVSLNNVATSTAAIGVSTAALQTSLNNVATSTAAIGVSTASLQTQVNSLNTSTATIATSTASLQTQVNALGVSTNTLAVSTGTLYTLASNKVALSSITATAPITYNNTTGGIGFTQNFSTLTLTSTFTVTYATINLNGVNYSFPSSGTIGNYLQYASTNSLQWGAVSASGGVGGSGYALEPATVTINANVGIQATTGTFSSSVTVQGGVLDSSAAVISGQVNISSYTLIVSSGTTSALSITANGTYGSNNGTSGGLLMDCTGGGGASGMCGQVYSNAGAQTALDALWYIRANNTAWNEPLLYLSNASTSAQSTIRIDSGWPTISMIDTTIVTGNSGKKCQWSLHLGVLRLECRNEGDTAFDSAVLVSSMSSNGDVAIGRGYNSATNTQLQVITSTSNSFGFWVSTSVNGPYAIDVSTNGWVTMASSLTVQNAGGLGVTYGIAVGSMTASSATLTGQFTAGTYQGGSLAACGDGSHALSWSAGSFGCQAISAGTGDMILASTQTVTGAKTFSSSSTFNGTVTVSSNVMLGGSNGTAGQVFTTGVTGAPTWITGPSLSSTQTWTGGNTFTSSATFTSTVTLSGLVQITTGTVSSASSGLYLSSGASAGFDAYQLPAYVLTSTVTWTNGNIQISSQTANTTYLFNAPNNSASLTLVIFTGAGGFTATWPANVKWPTATAPTITTGASKTDIIACKYLKITGNYYCIASQDIR